MDTSAPGPAPSFRNNPQHDVDEALERAHRLGGPGWEPAWSRVWKDGVDVTDSPELWPYPWNPNKRPGER